MDRDLCEESAKEQSLKLEVASAKSTALKSFQVKGITMTTRAQGQSGLQPSPIISEPCDIGQTVLFLSPLDALVMRIR